MSFEFTRNGVTYRVHTEVGAGQAAVVVEESEQPQPSMEPEEQ